MRAQQTAVDAKLIEARQTCRAIAAIPERIDRHQRASLQVGAQLWHERTQLDDLTGEFVPHDQRRHTQRIVPQIAA